jgi:DNA-binding Xre family transcriptional regulator
MKLENFNKIIAKNIEKLLIDKDMSKTELAKRLGIQDKSVSYIFRKLKRGETINNSTLCKWSEAMNVDISDFFCNIS